ncbi:10272_t:CDS:1, partial [Acaulospora colombiana]
AVTVPSSVLGTLEEFVVFGLHPPGPSSRVDPVTCLSLSPTTFLAI